MEEYFSNKGDFEREKIQQILSNIYEESKDEIDNECIDVNSLRFFYIVKRITPHQPSVSIINAVYILMAYYFESCDIFQNPNSEEK